jgi:hypothetical protein
MIRHTGAWSTPMVDTHEHWTCARQGAPWTSAADTAALPELYELFRHAGANSTLFAFFAFVRPVGTVGTLALAPLASQRPTPTGPPRWRFR